MNSEPTNAVEPGTTDSTQPLPETIKNTTSSISGNKPESADPNSAETPPFDLTEPFDMTFHARGRRGKVKVRHVVANPNLQQLKERDAEQPYRTRQVSDDVEEPIPDLQNRADEKLYNKIVVLTEGYRFNVAPDQSPEDREAALTNIPREHKKNVIGQIVVFDTKYVPEPIEPGQNEDTETYQWGENLSYKFATEFGFEGMFTAISTMKEPEDGDLDDFRTSTKFANEKGSHRKPVSRMTVDLKPAVTTFDRLVENIEGFVVNGEAFDAKNPEHLKLVSPYFKRSVLNALVKQTQLDLGN